MDGPFRCVNFRKKGVILNTPIEICTKNDTNTEEFVSFYDHSNPRSMTNEMPMGFLTRLPMHSF